MKTLLIIKPDWSEDRGFISELLTLIEDHELKVVDQQTLLMDEEFWICFYGNLSNLHFFTDLIQYMSSAPSSFLVIEGDDAVNIVRHQIIGRGKEGLREKYKIDDLKNVAHTSDSEEAANRELDLFHRLI